MKATVENILVTNINPKFISGTDDEAYDPSVALVAQRFTREDGEVRVAALGFNRDGETREELVQNLDEPVGHMQVMLGLVTLHEADILEGADVEVLNQLDDIEVGEAA